MHKNKDSLINLHLSFMITKIFNDLIQQNLTHDYRSKSMADGGSEYTNTVPFSTIKYKSQKAHYKTRRTNPLAFATGNKHLNKKITCL